MNLTLNTPAAIAENGVDAVREIEGRSADTLRVLPGPDNCVAVAYPAAGDIAPGHILHLEPDRSLRIESRVARNSAAAIFRCSPIEEESDDAANQES